MAERRRPEQAQGNSDNNPDEILKRVERDADVVGTSALARNVEKARSHFSGADKDQSDPIEVWGTRIGRGLSVVAFIVLAIWLLNFLGRAG